MISFILRSEENRFKKFKDDLKSSANSITLTEAFNLLLRESGDHDTVRSYNPRFKGSRGGRGSRGRKIIFAQSSRGGGRRGNEFTHSRMNNNATEVVAGANGEISPQATCFGYQLLGYYRDQCPCATRTVFPPCVSDAFSHKDQCSTFQRFGCSSTPVARVTCRTIGI